MIPSVLLMVTLFSVHVITGLKIEFLCSLGAAFVGLLPFPIRFVWLRQQNVEGVGDDIQIFAYGLTMSVLLFLSIRRRNGR